ncbi:MULTISPECIES: enoyl-CoA hydratase family protein [Pseudomonadaceae]|jgi:enoyl-CoA hydratase|uniref:enoyl-CoA hydratase family protein n=1 Tax=Pseudomonadaceae TaxID=135621 RepID=UPI0015E39381|nr:MULTISPECIES: enoyl-CoA hydratase family protein [Pseudomonadaceae]MBA1277576.1 enoyl-CoA hydratase family protein [Stutzerimonas stutzeri]MBC8650838.1 enoyl-CoA hydratase family protein [Pseudomonas sp. MT4]QXY91205.1 enoyl-CoA hydratase family protein [Pseudomonas sp. MTM4]
MSSAFKVEINQGVAELVLAKPPVNALDSEEWLALAARIDELGANAEVRVLIIRAEGRGFCAGVDIKELDAHPERIVKVNAGNYATFKAIHRCKVPVIVAVHGFVLGGGIGMTGAADIVLASRCATFALPEVDRGAMGGGAHLQRLFPVQKVRYMFFTGETVTAPDAMRYGFIEKLVEREELPAAAREIAVKIAAKSPAMIGIAKEALNGIEDGNLEDKYRWEQGFTLEAYTLPDSAETRRAFVEKRDTQF